MLERTRTAPAGLEGGLPGALSSMRRNGEPLRPKVQVALERGDVLELRTAGGGGYGPPAERAPAALAADIEDGIVTRPGESASA
jgi:N-methylhydantoinase B